MDWRPWLTRWSREWISSAESGTWSPVRAVQFALLDRYRSLGEILPVPATADTTDLIDAVPGAAGASAVRRLWLATDPCSYKVSAVNP